MESVFEQVEKRPYSLTPLSQDVLRTVWSSLCTLLHRTLSSGKGFGMPQFGVWTFRADKQDLGNTKKTLKTPVFILSEKFARTYNINCKKPLSTGGVPVTNLNMLAIASLAGRSRDEATAALKDIFLYVGDVARSGRTLDLVFDGVGVFTCSHGTAHFIFDPAFAGTFESLGFSTRAPILRPNTAPNMSSRRGGGTVDWGATAAPISSNKIPPVSAAQFLQAAGVGQSSSRPNTSGGRAGSRGGGIGGLNGNGNNNNNNNNPYFYSGPDIGVNGVRPQSSHQQQMQQQMQQQVQQHLQNILPRPPSADARLQQQQPYGSSSSQQQQQLQLPLRPQTSSGVGSARGKNNNNNNNTATDMFYNHNDDDRFNKTASTVGGGVAEYDLGGTSMSTPGRRMHSSRCRCKWCVVRENYNRQIEEKMAKMGAEERVDQELVKMSLARNEVERLKEKREEEVKRRARLEIERFNSEILGDTLTRKKQFGPLPFEDMFSHKIEEQRAVLSKDQIRELLNEQVERKRELAALESETDRIDAGLLDQTAALQQSGVERDKMLEARREAAQRRRADLEQQIKDKRSVICEPVTSAVWEAIPRIRPSDLEDKRERQKKVQEEVLAQLRERELAREKEKEEEARRVQEEVKRLQELMERTELQRQMEETEKKLKQREIWTSQISERRRREKVSRRPLSGSTGFCVGSEEQARSRHEGEPVPLSSILMSQSLPFR